MEFSILIPHSCLLPTVVRHGVVTKKLLVLVDLNVKDFDAVTSFCKEKNISLVVVGPEDPLAAGIADVLTQHGKLYSLSLLDTLLQEPLSHIFNYWSSWPSCDWLVPK